MRIIKDNILNLTALLNNGLYTSVNLTKESTKKRYFWLLSNTPDRHRIAMKLLQYLLLFLVWVYQRLISPLKPASCRFTPTCSEYAAQALRRHGPWRGTGLAIKRLSKCHPWGSSGYDPVP
ncbi:MAG: Membrane protein insertion efficiency factor YidD [uncultured Adhaeribacter sp.]|uniref:Putative membrane protein insertion efficiency factor n=1 Tax=uncultured Adhaeribacter sp. TaxID=448109 RepID=A0A6J4HD15_9BACT|nr:MAG: Membrane protein insertion efficiency factor YidD [uncultured Adhaeribacter sp.]